jgi:hypothetical protein
MANLQPLLALPAPATRLTTSCEFICSYTLPEHRTRNRSPLPISLTCVWGMWFGGFRAQDVKSMPVPNHIGQSFQKALEMNSCLRASPRLPHLFHKGMSSQKITIFPRV